MNKTCKFLNLKSIGLNQKTDLKETQGLNQVRVHRILLNHHLEINESPNKHYIGKINIVNLKTKLILLTIFNERTKAPGKEPLKKREK